MSREEHQSDGLEVGGFVVPRRLSIQMVVGAVAFIVGLSVQAVRLEVKVQAHDAAIERLAHMERMLCTLCVHDMGEGHVACRKCED